MARRKNPAKDLRPDGRDDHTTGETLIIVLGATLAIHVGDSPLLLAGVLVAVWLALMLCKRLRCRRRRPRHTKGAS